MNSETTFQNLNGRMTSRTDDQISAPYPTNIVYQVLSQDRKTRITEVGVGPYFRKTHACGESKKIETMSSTFMISDDVRTWPRPGYSAGSVHGA
ncbi:MAG: hypothetical protein ACK5P7_12985 [Bdellovibrio sp.]